MELNELQADERFLFENIPCARLEPGEIIVRSGRVELGRDNSFLLRHRESTFSFRITDSSQERAVQDLLQRRFICLASLDKVAEKRFFSLRAVFFLRKQRFGDFYVLLNDRVKKGFRQKGYSTENNAELADLFRFSDGVSEESCFAFMGQSADRVAKDFSEEESVSKGDNAEDYDAAEGNNENADKLLRDSDKGTGKTLLLCGKGCFLFVRLEGMGKESRAIAYRVRFTDRKTRYDALHFQLAYGELMFSDEQRYVAERVREILHETPNYITIWNEYAKREGTFLLDRARAVGTISYPPKYNATAGGIEVFLEPGSFDSLAYLSVGDYLEARSEAPPYIEDSAMDWTGYRAWQQTEEEGEEATAPLRECAGKQRKRMKRRPSYPRFEVVGKGKNSLVLKGEGSLPEGDKLYLSIYGDERQIETREIARQRIEDGTSASPALGLVLGSHAEDTGRHVAFLEKNRRHIPPRSAILSDKIFRNEPTPNQIQAIDIALNTPDIAVIQGPPGTGKTTVITAILERLNELSDKSNVAPGQVLVTSLQHDAVQNIIERIEINSLPTIKFGNRASDDNMTLTESVSRWCGKICGALEKKHPMLRQTEEERRIFEAFDFYNQSPNHAKAIRFLQMARDYVHDQIVLAEIGHILRELAPERPADEGRLLSKIRRLRTKRQAFLDDGRDAATDLYNDLKDLYGEHPSKLQGQNLDILRMAAMSVEADEELMFSLKELQQRLLSSYTRMTIPEEEEVREDIVQIYVYIKQSLQRPNDKMENAIYDLYREIRDNPYAVRQAVASYNFVFAATAQQSDRKEIKKAKGVEWPADPNTHAEYETVVVDEAARVAPGDLMIPLSQASRRIILVGDQRQLPHIYDEEIFQSLREDGKLEDEGDVKTSMFEHLWNKARELEKTDGIVRAVTLDAQYRMHPVLGQFVSDHFYKPYGEGFSSPRPAEQFSQGICETPLSWIHIGAEHGTDRRTANRSLCRKCEVDYIAAKLKEYLADSRNDGMTFGVISFYRAQAQEIKKSLGQEIAEFGSRVRIGTVDEFQGMEFDVMFLSVVRSGKDFSNIDFAKLEEIVNGAEEESARRAYVQRVGAKLYGFLTDNRLCVALSRQKCLLIVVGDADMFRTGAAARAARTCVPAMYALYGLAESMGAVVEG